MYEAMTADGGREGSGNEDEGCAEVRAIKQPLNIVDVTYARTGGSVNTDAMGMREMQQRVFAKRDAQHLLIKAPPASGKSRALMFVALDKLYNQGRKKVIVAVPERSIGASFASTSLTDVRVLRGLGGQAGAQPLRPWLFAGQGRRVHRLPERPRRRR